MYFPIHADACSCCLSGKQAPCLYCVLYHTKHTPPASILYSFSKPVSNGFTLIIGSSSLCGVLTSNIVLCHTPSLIWKKDQNENLVIIIGGYRLGHSEMYELVREKQSWTNTVNQHFSRRPNSPFLGYFFENDVKNLSDMKTFFQIFN
jgi:hypothetical protein